MPDERPAALPATYGPGETEPAQYAAWEAAGTFRAAPGESRRAGGARDPFTVVIPPPNVTAVLHMGHGLNATVQDVLVRWRRMAGDAALWVPGTDHAGIATQNVVEKLLAAEGATRFDVGREAFVARVRAFVDRTGGEILRQLRAIGASADWDRTAYTLSPALSRAVREAFVRLHERGLVYRGRRVIHWCPRCLTALSDEEAEFHDETGALHRVAYPVQGEPGRAVEVATTRPETMLGDVAVAVHPEDERYRDLVGRHVVLPLVGVAIPVVADAYADPAFGTGVVKITPAHDANDFEVGQRHGLPAPVVIDEHGVVREGADAAGRVPPAFAGLDRMAARAAVVAALRAAGALVAVAPHAHAVRRCYRCDTVVEPRLSAQWFVRMAPLAEPALAAVRDGTVRILPERWEAVYVQWMSQIRDWNISRQIWWGHRIPVWYDRDGGVHVRREDPTPDEVARLGLVQDPDVLDTWFSSWLWPLSTLGWPDEDTDDQRAFFPTDVLVTAPEILFFWVARMIMAGYAFRGTAPFHTVYLHGTVRDAQHRKMSKSLGNGIDPLDVVRRYGADALRWTVISGLGFGADLQLDHEDIEQTFAPGRNFCTKLWNIGRFLLGNIGDAPVPAVAALPPGALTAADEWILARLDAAIADCDAALGPPRPRDGRWRPEERGAGLRLNEYAEAARRFAWNEFADWYVEAAKDRLKAAGADREVARAVLVHAFDQALRLLHPIVPFITEAIWQRLPGRPPGALLATAAWPRPSGIAWDPAPFARGQEVVLALRQIRGDYGVAPATMLDAHLVGPADGVAAACRAGAPLAARLARTTLHATPAPEGPAAHAVLADGVELIVPLAGAVDLAKECARLRAELDGLERQLAALEGRLASERFTAKAPPAVVAAERAKAAAWAARRAQLQAKVRSLCGA